jgi:NAD(P)H-dependent FMN reductase
MKHQNILILDGSPKNQNSTSTVLSEFLAKKLLHEHIETKRKKISSGTASKEDLQEFINDVRSANLIFLIFPLYVDGPPYNVMHAMELIKTHLTDREQNSQMTFMALCQSGMEVHKNRIALQICECFAKDLGFRLGGTFAFGFGGVLNGASLTSLNRLTRNVQKALTIIAHSIANHKEVPAEVQNLLAKPLVPGPMSVKRYLFNAAMKSCWEKKSFIKGVDWLHSRLKLIYS